MKKIILIVAGCLATILTFVILLKCVDHEKHLPTKPNNPLITTPKPSTPPISPIKNEPKWSIYPPTHNIHNLGKILSDVESHMDYSKIPTLGNGIYQNNDRVTWTHETTHGINGVLRNLYGYAQNSECLYCLDSKFVMIQEPKIAKNIAQAYVPPSLQQTVFNTLQRNYNALYVLDEWISYTNGSEAKLDLNLTTRGGTVQYMTNHIVYTLATAMTIQEHDPDYNDTQLKAFVKWNIERNFKILNQDQSGEGRAYLETFRTSEDAATLRAFSQEWLGQDFTKKYFKF